MKKQLIFILGLGIISCSKGPNSDSKVQNFSYKEREKDSLEMTKLLSNMYKWHEEKRTKWRDFEFTYANDRLKGIDSSNLENYLTELKRCGFFSEKFISDYKQIGNSLETLIRKASPELSANELNFPFEESDPWNGFQDDAGDYWNSFKVVDFYTTKTNASFNWWLQGKDGNKISDNYLVKFTREKDRWKIDFLVGFDKKYFE